MAKNRAYREAEQKIESALRSGATKLDLSIKWEAEASEKLTELPESIAHLTGLRDLNLSFNQLTALPEAIGQLTDLRDLNLSYNRLTALPEALKQLTDLRNLYLSDSRLTALPEAIGQLTNLRNLYLSDNRLTALPEAIEQLTDLRELDLSYSRLTALPEAIGQLTNLRNLYLSDNRLTALPEAIEQLTDLRSLNLARNQLTALPEALGQLTDLRKLDLSGNQLTALPEALGQLTDLRELSISINRFTVFPECISFMESLEILYLVKNEITTIPSEIGKLKKIKRIYLGGNNIAQNHRYGGNYKKSGNRVSSLPVSIHQLSSLVELNLDYNPLNPELAAAYEQGLDAVKTYLQAKEKGQIILNEAKLILVGEGGVGKTSLLSALREELFVENRPTTHGIEVDIKSLSVSAHENGADINLNCWDFGGQNIYRHTHQLFFTAPAVYLAVWEPRRGPEQSRVAEWIKMIKHRAYDESRPEERPRILVVATHGGPAERLDHIDEQALRDEFGDLVAGFHHVDSKPDENGMRYQLDELKAAIGREAAAIPSVGRAVPLSWKNVLEALRKRSEKDPYIHYVEFEKLCDEQGVSKKLAATYAVILNELGHLIYYRDDETLQNTVILNPEYLSKAVGFVLEDKDTKEAYGLVEHDRLSKIWYNPDKPENERYPYDLHSIFLRLMNKFDLSYQVMMPQAKAPPASLVAQLVPGQRPEGWRNDWTLKSGDVERTQVCRVLDAEIGRATEAEGLIYRLIVRLHRYSLGRNNYYDSRHWKTGMILDNDYNGRAFIEEIGGDVYITVRAAYPERFLHHLCSEVEWLVEHFWKGLDARMYVPCPDDKCKGLVELDEMLENKANEMSKISCRVCRKYHVIDDLMATMQPKPQYQDAIEKLSTGQKKILGALEKGFDSVDAQLRVLMSQVDEQYEALLTTLTDTAKEGPRSRYEITFTF